MLRTKNLISAIDDIPVEWIFEHYLQLPQRLTGQDIRMKSMFSPSDTKPSFYVFFSSLTNAYRFKDFSSGLQGDAITLVQLLHKFDRASKAIAKIITDYGIYVANKGLHTASIQNVQVKYKVTSIKVRNWTEHDRDYWIAYHIGSKLLEGYCVKPLEYFVLTKKDNSTHFIVKGICIYGYFRKDGTLYKIYQPLSKDTKFIKVRNYIQGADQLTYTKPYLGILSSLKDMMSFVTLGFTNIEIIAPDSENVLISKTNIAKLKSKYKGVFTLLDNDPAGIKAMQAYLDLYGLPPVHLKFEKDLAACSKTHGVATTKELTKPLILRALSQYLNQPK